MKTDSEVLIVIILAVLVVTAVVLANVFLA